MYKEKVKHFIVKVLIVIALITLLFLLIFSGARYGWKLFGFSMCSDAVGIEGVTVSEDSVVVKGFNPSTFSLASFVGYTAKQKGETLFIGVKFNKILGVLPDDSGNFEINIPVKGDIAQVVLKNSKNEMTIWDNKEKHRLLLKLDLQGVLVDELHYTCYLGDTVVANVGVVHNNTSEENTIMLELLRDEFPDGADLNELSIEFAVSNERGEMFHKEPICLLADWGQTHDFVIAKKEGDFFVEYYGISEF